MLPPNAKEANAKKLKAHKQIKSHSTMERLLAKITFQNALKVVDLSRKQLVATKLQQAGLGFGLGLGLRLGLGLGLGLRLELPTLTLTLTRRWCPP